MVRVLLSAIEGSSKRIGGLMRNHALQHGSRRHGGGCPCCGAIYVAILNSASQSIGIRYGLDPISLW